MKQHIEFCCRIIQQPRCVSRPALDATVTELIARAEAATRKEDYNSKKSVDIRWLWNCLIRGSYGQICERLNRSRSDFQNKHGGIHDIQNVYMCTSFGVLWRSPPHPHPHHPAQWAKSLGVINHLNLNLSLSRLLARSLSLFPLPPPPPPPPLSSFSSLLQ